MWPQAFKVGPVTVYFFGLFLAVAFLVGLFIVWKEARRRGLVEEKVLDITFLAVIAAIFGGRLGFVLTNWTNLFSADWGRIFLLFKYPGISFWGALAAAIFVVVVFSHPFGLEIFATLDMFALAFSWAVILGFLGCLLDSCSVYQPSFLGLLVGLGVVWAVLLVVLNSAHRKYVAFSVWQRRAGMIFLCYLIFQSISFLMLSVLVKKEVDKLELVVLLASTTVFLVRYKEIVGMVKFPASALNQIRKFLEKRRSDLESRRSELSKEDPFSDKSRLLDRASDDAEASYKAGHERITALSHQVDLALIQTRKALTKIKIGKYGICGNCGKMIDTDRLAAMPTATLCLACEKKRER